MAPNTIGHSAHYIYIIYIDIASTRIRHCAAVAYSLSIVDTEQY